MIFKHAKASILTNGFRVKYFIISRSMRQRCPISPLLYILQAEPLACAIGKNRNNVRQMAFIYTYFSKYLSVLSWVIFYLKSVNFLFLFSIYLDQNLGT